MMIEGSFYRSLLLLVGLHTRFVSPTNSWAWSSLNAATAAPHVSGHSVATIGSDRILLFGGLTGSAGSPATNDVWCFTIEDQQWKPLTSTAAEGPGPRMYAASAVLNNYFYVMGGWDPGAPGSGGMFLEDVWKLCLTTMEWTKEAKSMPCGPVSRHAACTVGDNTIVVHTFRGTLVYDRKGLREQQTTGETPEGLSMCAMIPMGDDSLILIGGSTKTQALSNDVYLLNTGSWEWRKLRWEPGTGPAPLASPCGASIDPKRCVLFGGATLNTAGYQGGAGLQAQDQTWLLTLEDDDDAVTWTKIDKGPEGRVAASLSALAGGKFVLQGGWDPATKSTFDTPWILDMTAN